MMNVLRHLIGLIHALSKLSPDFEDVLIEKLRTKND